MKESQKNQSEISATEGLLRISIPFLLVGAIMTFVVLSTRKAH